MTQNPTFERALALLAHPVSLVALLALLVNDHLLRRLWPGWWTGKLGDFAWLLFFPFLLAALLAWLPKRERIAFPLAFAATGLGFALLKASPAGMAGFLRLASEATGARFTLIADSSDWIALPALAGAFLLYRNAQPGRFSRSGARLLLLPLAALLTIANSGAPDYGVLCFAPVGQTIVAQAGYGTYTSQDGGETWEEIGPIGVPEGCQREAMPETGQWIAAAGPREGVTYRYRPGEVIQVSTDGGATWQDGYRVTGVSEAQEIYGRKTSTYAAFEAGPVDAYADPATGRMLFAMGQQGVLIHQPNGAWNWAAVGAYRVEAFPTGDAFGLLVGAQGYQAAALALLLLGLFLLRRTFNRARVALLVLAALAWLVTDILFPPAGAYNYGTVLAVGGLAVTLLLLVILLVSQIVHLARSPGKRGGLLPLAGIALLGGLLFLLPYVLWMYSTLPNLGWATGFGIAIAIAAAAAGLALERRAAS